MIGNDCVNHSVSDRDCSHCIWHTDGRCASWDCEYISRKEALEAVRKVKNEAPMELPPEQSTHSNTPNTLETLDCISRHDAIDAVVKAIRNDPCYDSNERINGLGVCDVRVIINDLPSAQPRKGKWIRDRDSIYHCSCCGTDYLIYDAEVQDTHYCPNCGAEMEGVQE